MRHIWCLTERPANETDLTKTVGVNELSVKRFWPKN